jgi:MFS family permease
MTPELKKNIKLSYIFAFLDSSLFWIAIWFLYYLRFTDYAGIGILESVMISTTVFGEIPTGAIADLLGKKYTLSLAFLFGAIGNLLMGLADTFSLLAIGVVIATLGTVLSSGTTEAFVYDTLLSIKEEKKYQKILANISSIKMIALAISSIIGGWLYKTNPSFPFYLVSIFQILALLVSFLLKEPPIDSEVFSWENYKKQVFKGFQQLFKKGKKQSQNIFIIVMSSIIFMNDHMLIDAQLVAEGWSATQLGWITAIMFFISAGMGQLSSFFANKWGKYLSNILSALSIAISMVLIPHLGILIATAFLLLRFGIAAIFNNSASAHFNEQTPSKYRATTLSTYNMVANIPYVLGAFLIGKLMDIYSVHNIAAYLGYLLLVAIVVAFGDLVSGKKKVEN